MILMILIVLMLVPVAPILSSRRAIMVASRISPLSLVR